MKNTSGIIIKVLIGLFLVVLILFFTVPDKLKEKIIKKVERIVNKSTEYNQLATNAFPWPAGKRCAVSLTFDDAWISQVDKAIPLLDKYGVKATFYVLPDNLKKNLEAWKKAVKNGHDIGNHSILHPCSGNFQWSRQMGRALEDYTTERMHAELDSANKVIKVLLGIVPVSFGYPCGQTFIGRGTNTLSYVPLISSMFETGRGYPDESTNDPAFCDMAQLAGMPMDGKSFHEIKKLIESAKNQGSWLILVGHKINEGSNTDRLSTIKAICKYSMAPSNDIWIDNVHDIASFINSKRVKN